MPAHTKSRTIALLIDGPGTEASVGDGKVYWPVPADLNGYSLTDARASCVESGLGGALEVMVENIKFDDLRVAPTAPSKVPMLTANLSLAAGAINAIGSVVSNGDQVVSTGHRLRIKVITLNGAVPGPKGLMITLTFN